MTLVTDDSILNYIVIYLHLYKWVRIAIGVHRCQMSTPNYTHNQTTLLAVVGERNQDTSPLLCLFTVLTLKKATEKMSKHINVLWVDEPFSRTFSDL